MAALMRITTCLCIPKPLLVKSVEESQVEVLEDMPRKTDSTNSITLEKPLKNKR